MKRFKRFYILIFILIIFSASIIIHFTDWGYLSFDNRMKIRKPQAYNLEYFKNFNADNFETMLKDYYLRDDMVLAGTFFDKYIFNRPFINDVQAKSPNIFDMEGEPAYSISFDDAEKNIINSAEKLAEIRDKMRANGGDLLIIPVPKISAFYQYPSYILDPEPIDKAAADLMFREFDKHNLSYVDLRKVLAYEYYYKTDHHMSKAGSDKLIEIINEHLKEKGKALNDARIDVEVHEFKGSRSKRAAYLTGTDDIFEPIYFTDFKRSGDGHEDINNFKENIGYPSYMYGDNKYTCIETDEKDGADLIIYGDSYTNIVEAFIWPRLKRMRSYDFRPDLRAADEKRPQCFYDTDLLVLIADETSFRLERGYIFYSDEDFDN